MSENMQRIKFLNFFIELLTATAPPRWFKSQHVDS